MVRTNAARARAGVAMAPLLTELTLYHYPSTRSNRVLWLLHELGAAVTGPVTLKQIDLLEGEGRSKWYRQLSCVRPASRSCSFHALACPFLRQVPRGQP